MPVPTDYGLEISFAHNIHFQTPLLMEHHIHQLKEILYLIFDYPHKHYTFKYFKV